MQHTRHLTKADVQLVELYAGATPEAQKYIFRMIALTAEHGDAFMKEAEAEAARGGKEALTAVIEKWSAKDRREQNYPAARIRKGGYNEMATKEELKAALRELPEDQAMPYLYELTYALERKEEQQRAEFIRLFRQLTPEKKALVIAKMDELLAQDAAC